MNVHHIYAQLRDACTALDENGDHAVAAYIGHGIALLEAKYGIDPGTIACGDVISHRSTGTRHDGGSSWA